MQSRDVCESDHQQLDRVLALVGDVLGSDAAAYLFGSAVLGGLRPGSDLDRLRREIEIPLSGMNALGCCRSLHRIVRSTGGLLYDRNAF